MFNFNSTDRRHGRQRSSRNSFSSKASIASAITSSSGASSGSNSTITNDSFGRRRAQTSTSRSRLTSRQQRTRSQSSTERQDNPAPQAPKRLMQAERPLVNVFQFLEPWDSRAASRLSLNDTTDEESTSDEHQYTPQEAEADHDQVLEEETDSEEHSQVLEEDTESDEDDTTCHDDSMEGDTLHSFHSDSGISMKDDTPERSPTTKGPASMIADMVQRNSLPTTEDFEPEPSPSPVFSTSISIEDAESFYRSMTRPSSQLQHDDSPRQSGECLPKSFRDTRRERTSTSTKPRSSSRYRTFDKLNRRTLKSLQSELSMLESSLEKLDSEPSSSSSPTNYDNRDATRNHIRRQALLDQIQSKLEKYNRLLASFHQVRRSFPPTSHSKRGDDRVSLLLQTPGSHIHGHDLASSSSASALQTTCIFSTLAIVFPLLAFSVIPSFFGRLTLLLGFVTVGALGLGHESVIDLIGEREAKVCFFGYMGAMVGAALLVS